MLIVDRARCASYLTIILALLCASLSCRSTGPDNGRGITPRSITTRPGTGWFDDVPVLGAMNRRAMAQKLKELGEDSAAKKVSKNLEADLKSLFGDGPWTNTAHAFGYLAPANPGDGMLPIKHAGNMLSDPQLRGKRVKITLDRVRVADYPGGSVHTLLFDFYAQTQRAGGGVDHLHFNQMFEAKEGQEAAIVGYPIFVGLDVGSEGVSFRCFTVNVHNQDDERFLAFLDTDAFKGGLHLLTTAQPALGPLAGMAEGLARHIAQRNRNVAVQKFWMGLDFSNQPARAALAQGSYIAVQIPQTDASIWNWNDWVFNQANGQIVSKVNPNKLVPYNYLVFTVSRYDGV